MAIKNATLFRFPPGVEIDPIQLEAALQTQRYQAPDASAYQSSGWAPALNETTLLLTLAHGIYAMRRLTTSKILPSSTLAKEWQARVAGIEEQECRKVVREEELTLKDTVRSELLARTVSKDDTAWLIIHSEARLIIIDQASSNNAEAVLAVLQRCYPLDATLIRPRALLDQQMTRWVAGDELPDELHMGSVMHLQDESSEGPTIKMTNVRASGQEVQMHLQQGLIVTLLQLHWKERTSFRLTQNMQLRSIRTDIPLDEATNPEDRHARLLLDACEIAAITRTIIDQVDGWRLNSGDSQGLKEAILSWLSDAPADQHIAARTVAQHFGIKKHRAGLLLADLHDCHQLAVGPHGFYYPI